MAARRTIILSAVAASQYLLNTIMELESDSDSDSGSDELVRGFINTEMDLRLRGNRRKVSRVEGYVEYTIPRLSAKQFQQHFRIQAAVFDYLENRLGNMLLRKEEMGRPTIPVRKQLLATLWLLATPDSYRSIGCRFDLGKSSLFHCVYRVVEALNDIANDIIYWPRNDNLLITKMKFERISRLPNVIGAIDGTHIEIPAPEVDPEVYNTRKCRYAIVLQAVCDADMRFIDCFAGYPGSVGDIRVFRNSDLWHAVHANRNDFFPDEEYIIGDKAYPVLGWCIPPYRDNGHLTNIQKIFNVTLSSTRQVIERAFALLKGRFRRLHYLHMSRLDRIPKTIIACCVLHNLCINHIDVGQEDIVVEEPNVENEVENEIFNDRINDDVEGINKRNNIARTLEILNENVNVNIA